MRARDPWHRHCSNAEAAFIRVCISTRLSCSGRDRHEHHSSSSTLCFARNGSRHTLKLIEKAGAINVVVSRLVGASALAIFATDTSAQTITGVPGSPSATTTITGKRLPAPDPKFGGIIKDEALQSKPWWAPRIVPPKGAPNVLLIITDD